MNQSIYVGLDVHLNSITAAILEGDVQAPQVIKLPGDLNQTRRLFRRLARKGPVRACYEASGAGFVLQRVLSRDGFHCEVIAPSLIPKKPGDRRKTDRLDAVNLARLYKSGQLTPVHIPSREQEALRRLIRLRYEYVCYVTAITILAEIGDVRRFRSPRALMAYFGVVPSERSSGERERRGPITKAGNTHCRRLLSEAAWNNRHRGGADLILKRRRQGQPPEVVAIAIKAQHRKATSRGELR